MSTGFAPSALCQTVCPPLVLHVRGEHDVATVESLSLEFASAFDGGEPPIVIDLSGVTFMDTSTLHLLERARDYLAETNRSMVLRNPSRPAMRLLSLCDVISPMGFTVVQRNE